MASIGNTSNYAAREAFANISQTLNSGDYLQNKIAKIKYCNDVREPNCKRKKTQNELIIFNKGRLLNTYGENIAYNKNNLCIALYTYMGLAGIPIVSAIDAANPGNVIWPTTIDPLLLPFYKYYVVDPYGLLFGAFCNTTPYTQYMVYPPFSLK